MKKNIIAIVIGIVVLVLLALVFSSQHLMIKSDTQTTTPDTSAQSSQPLSFAYPNALTTTYIASNTWPPQVGVTQAAYSCTPSTASNTPEGTTIERTINGRVYCVTTASEGAAGSTYKTYTYETMVGENNVTIAFTLQYPQCANFTGAKIAACMKEESTFDVDSLVDTIIQSAAPASE